MRIKPLPQRPDGRELLYYPSFLPPSREWIQNSLLYWDSVSTIVPRYHEHEVMTDDLKELRDLGVYRPIDPSRALEMRWREGEDVGDELRERLHEPDVQRELARCTPEDCYHISVAKVTYSALEALRPHQGRPSEADRKEFVPDEWVAVKRPAALLYMSILAKAVAGAEGHLVQPSTDKESFESCAFGTGGQLAVRLVLEDALPQLRPNASFADVLRFRRQNQEELFAFRKLLSEVQAKLNKASNQREFKEITVDFQEQTAAAISRIERNMKLEGLKGLNSSVGALCRVSSPAVLGAIAGAVFPAAAPVSVALGAVAGGALWLNEVLIGARERNNKLSDQPMSYIFRASRM